MVDPVLGQHDAPVPTRALAGAEPVRVRTQVFGKEFFVLELVPKVHLDLSVAVAFKVSTLERFRIPNHQSQFEMFWLNRIYVNQRIFARHFFFIMFNFLLFGKHTEIYINS